METEADVRRRVREVVIGTITKRSSRDNQVLLGPSDLCNPCDHCLGKKFARSLNLLETEKREGTQGFSLAAWVGTAIHKKMEEDLILGDDEAQKEGSFVIGEIPGYGIIKGHVDLLMDSCVITDYKTVYMSKLKIIKFRGVPEEHVIQAMLYGLGVKNSGLNPRWVSLVYIPRDSNNVEDVWETAGRWRQDVAEEAFARAVKIHEIVRNGGAMSLPSQENCVPCTRFGRTAF